ncbi:DUF1499 domain-containing protein [Parasphingorhabdus cellanae]|uniref:DUF1499 domain-containing protein n=1 Tax=Parasphingorhabdus cellanae TaxID=2806553 RepID=A0ABX7T7E9_9SPHN|nr:DUF1499 domain-containing protein [Parasphingorhabdus cellanae]QTD57535.1 DUF1499 domain-containing protein [Parasphingorhabdus cellanae]
MNNQQDQQSQMDQSSADTSGSAAGKLAILRKDLKGWTVLVLALAAVIVFFGAAFGAGIGLWGWQAGLGALPWTGLVALIALIIAIIGIILDRRKDRKTRWPLLGLGTIVSLGFIGYLASYAITIASLPAIHDITTDLADPPQFSALTLRADNWDNIPGADDSAMRGMNPRQRWATVHQDAYPDIRSVRIDRPVSEVIEKAKRLAEARGWEVVSVDPASGNLEATATISLFRFKDDVVIRARSAENGASSIIDMRSVSRVGVHDLGANAKRVRQFLSDLSGTTTAASR